MRHLFNTNVGTLLLPTLVLYLFNTNVGTSFFQYQRWYIIITNVAKLSPPRRPPRMAATASREGASARRPPRPTARRRGTKARTPPERGGRFEARRAIFLGLRRHRGWTTSVRAPLRAARRRGRGGGRPGAAERPRAGCRRAGPSEATEPRGACDELPSRRGEREQGRRREWREWGWRRRRRAELWCAQQQPAKGRGPRASG